jgi:hypothetical protein
LLQGQLALATTAATIMAIRMMGMVFSPWFLRDAVLILCRLPYDRLHVGCGSVVVVAVAVVVEDCGDDGSDDADDQWVHGCLLSGE